MVRVKSQESRVKSRKSLSFPRSAWERNIPTLRVVGGAKRPRSGRVLRSHAERGNESPGPTFRPRPPAPSPYPPRRAITLTEVLISMGILTLGLLGVAALFPVGGWYMQQAVIADNGAAIGQSVMNDLVARGSVNPKAWYAMVPSPPSAAGATTSPNYVFPLVDGKYTGTGTPQAGSFTRPVTEVLSESLNTNVTAAIVSRQLGNAFVIDPMYVAAATTGSNNRSVVAYPFPAGAIRAFPRNGWNYYTAAGWQPWKAQNANERVWPIRRVTLQDPTGWSLNTAMAAHIFEGHDELTSDLPSRDDRPARQNWEVIDKSGTLTPLSRQSSRDYSWIVCVVPTTNAARDGMARNPEGYAYDVSVVVFYKRVLPSQSTVAIPDTQFINESAATERAVRASVVSTGPNGGELFLESVGDGITTPPFDNLKNGQWIMLCGPHPNSTTTEPRFSLNWYQVLSIETDGLASNQRLVSVRGPQWTWQPTTNWSYQNPELSNQLCVGICRGAVAVHTRTMRLESLRSSAWGGGMSVVLPSITPPGNNPIPY